MKIVTQSSSSLEAALTRKVKEWLKKQPDVAFFKASDRYQKGISDFIVCVRGIMVCLELKAEKGKPSQHQLMFLEEFEKAGAICGVCYTLEEVKELVEKARRMRDA